MIYFYCNWFDTRWQQYRTHLHTNNTQNGTYIKKEYINIKKYIIYKNKQKHTKHTTTYTVTQNGIKRI